VPFVREILSRGEDSGTTGKDRAFAEAEPHHLDPDRKPCLYRYSFEAASVYFSPEQPRESSPMC
jgi:hypothetical protein